MNLSLAASLACVASLTAPLAPAATAFTLDAIDYERAAVNFLDRNGRTGATSETLTLEEFVETEFLSATLGIFEVAVPRRSLATPSEPARYQGLCLNLLDAQRIWLDWARPDDPETETLRADLEAVREWIESWDTARLAAAAKETKQSVHELVGSEEETIELTRRFNEAVINGGLMAGGRKCETARVALFPTRADFVEMLCVIGYLRPNLQQYFWVEGLETWHQFNMTDMNLFGLAMSYPADDVTGSSYSNGERMEERNKNSLGEQITQLALNAMIMRIFDDNIPSTVIHSLSINLVIEAFGEIDTRADGHLVGRETEAREEFVPGGQSEGGILPTATAKNRWRVNQGRYHYVRPLRQAQKEGAKERGRSRIKHANFLLRSFDESARKLVIAPFLGSAAQELPPPASALAEDQAEFLRAYRIGFIHWLRTAGAGNKKESEAKFATWLRDLDARAATENFEQSLVTAYGVPLSAPELDKNCLEGRFLIWLAKQKS